MQSKASLFSKALLYKNLHRFWPILAAYTGIVLLLSFSLISRIDDRYELPTAEAFANTVFSLAEVLPVLIGFFSIIVAAAVFSFMFNPVATAMINALPFTRRTVYISNYISGLIMVIIPLLVFFFCLLGIGLGYECLDMAALFNWLYIFVSLSLLLYSLAVAVGMFTGHIIAHLALFGIANFLLIGLESLIRNFLVWFLYGCTDRLYDFSPLLLKATPIVYAARMYLPDENFPWGVWLVYILVGVIFTWIAGAMYSRRKMENAGDVIAIRKLYPVFKYGVAFCSTLTLGTIMLQLFNRSDSFSIAVVLFLLGGAIGYFVAEMLLHKTFRVLYSYKGYLVFAGLMLVLGLSIYYDWYGYASRFPDPDRVETVAFSYWGIPYGMANILQAEKSYVDLDGAYHLPDSLALAYGNPISSEKRNNTIHYNYPRTGDLTPEQTRLLWRVTPGVMTADDSIEKVLGLHEYLAENVSTIRRNYRMNIQAQRKDPSQRFNHYNIGFIYRLDTGELERYLFPVAVPVNPSGSVDQEIMQGLASLVGCQEERDKKTKAIDQPLERIKRINVDLGSLGKWVDLQQVWFSSSDGPMARAIEITKQIPWEEHQSAEIRGEDIEGFIKAVIADYETMSDQMMLEAGQKECGAMEIWLENPDLPENNRYRERHIYIGIGFDNRNVFNFLTDKGYIDQDTSNYISNLAKMTMN